MLKDSSPLLPIQIKKRKDGLELLQIMRDFTGQEAKMWGPSIIGFGEYHYKSERSRKEGYWPIVGFSTRKAVISLYVYYGGEEQNALLEQLGKFKMGKGCIYVKELSDIDVEVLKKLMQSTIASLKAKYN